MTLLHALVGFGLVVGVLTLVPGIDTALVLRSALTRSRGYALATVLGVSTGIVVWGAAAVPADSAWRGWWTGALTNLLNPKVGVFYLATIPQFMVTGVPPLAMGVLLALVHAALCTAWLGLIALGAGWAGPRLGSSAVVRWTDRVTGGVLLAFGGRLALQARA